MKFTLDIEVNPNPHGTFSPIDGTPSLLRSLEESPDPCAAMRLIVERKVADYVVVSNVTRWDK